MSELLAIAADLELLARRLRSYAVNPGTPPTPTPDPGDEAAFWDNRLTRRGVTVWALPSRFELIEARYMPGDEGGGLHHILLDAQNRDGSRKVGATALVRWPDGEHTITIEAKPGEPWGGNFAMFAPGGSYSLRFEGWEISGMGLGTIEEPGWAHHVSYGFVFRER